MKKLLQKPIFLISADFGQKYEVHMIKVIQIWERDMCPTVFGKFRKMHLISYLGEFLL